MFHLQVAFRVIGACLICFNVTLDLLMRRLYLYIIVIPTC